MNVIFLDFDGVLNHDDSDYSQLKFSEDNISNLKRLLKHVPADIVVTSSWRKKMTVGEMNRFFSKNGLPSDRIISKVPEPDESGGRGREIDLWLNSHPEVERYVVIDDKDDDLQDYTYCLVQPVSSRGLTSEDAEKAAKILMAGY